MNSRSTVWAGVGGLALLGAAVATCCDAIHVHTQTLSYPRPFLFGQGPFVFPGFVFAFLTMGASYLLLASRLPATVGRDFSVSPGTTRELAESLTTFAFVYLLSGFGNREPLLLSTIFYATAGLRLTLAPDRAFMTVVAVTLAVFGILAEGTMTRVDLVHYREPEIYGVPVWLGALYMHGAFALRDGMRRFVYGRGLA